MAAVAKFFTEVVSEKCEESITDSDLPDTVSEMNSSSIVKVGVFLRLLNNSFMVHLQSYTNPVNSQKRVHLIFQAAEFLSPYFSSHIEDICQLLIKDGISEELSSRFNTEDIHMNTSSDDTNDLLDITPLFPTDNNSTILYVIVLNGLCQGGVDVNKVQLKSKVSDIIIPNLKKLLQTLPMHSTDILAPILNLCSLFSFEDWIHVGLEKSIPKIMELIMKLFMESTLDLSLIHI